MTWDRVLVNLIGLGLVGGIVWFFWLVKTKGVEAATSHSGYQERWSWSRAVHADLIVVEAGKPVRLAFVRQESASCTEMVLLELSASRRASGGGRPGGVPPEGAWGTASSPARWA